MSTDFSQFGFVADQEEQVEPSLDEFGFIPDEVQQEAPQTIEQGLREGLRKPGALVKGLGKGIAAGPRIAQAIPLALGSKIFQERKPRPSGEPAKAAPPVSERPAFASKIDELLSQALQAKVPIEEFIGRQFESKFKTRPEERPFEEVGQSIGENIALGINPIAAFFGATAKQIAKEAGGGEMSQLLAEFAGLSVPSAVEASIKTAVKQVSGKTLKTPSGLPKFREPKAKGILKPIITKGRKEKVIGEVLEKAEDLFETVVEENLPAKQAINKGIDIDGVADVMFDAVDDVAKQVKTKISSKSIANELSKKVTALKTGVEPSIEDATAILQLNRNVKNLLKNPNQSAEILLQQYRNNNKNVKRLYNKFNKTPQEIGKMKAAATYNEVLKDILTERIPDKRFKFVFEKSNQLFAETKKLEKFTELSQKFLKEGKLDPRKFNTFMENPKNFKKITGIIGEQGAKDLKLLASDLNKITKDIGKIETLGFPTIVKKALLKFIPVAGTPLAVGKTVTELALGYIYSSPQRITIFKDFIKAVKGGNVARATVLAPKVETMIDNANKSKKVLDDFGFKED